MNAPAPGAETSRSEAADAPLRDDVRRLGATVGEILAEQLGAEFLEAVERVRTGAIRRREEEAPLDDLQALLAGLPIPQAEALTRAFSLYFQVVNIAERVHRIRRRRDYQRESATPQPESLHDALARLKASGVSAKELVLWLGRLDVEPVFTAHPTEAVRRSILEKEQEIVRCLVAEFDPTLTPAEHEADWGRLRMALTATWQTREIAEMKPTVQDEFEQIGFYLAGPLYNIVPTFYETLESALQKVYGAEMELPRVLRFGSWVGGDMDGNSNVGAETIAAALASQRDHVLDRYVAETGELASLLSQTSDRVDVAAELLRRVEHYRALVPRAAASIRPRHADMPYRVFLTLVRARLRATQRQEDGAYPNAQAFRADVELVSDSLLAGKGLHAGWFAVRRLLWRVRTFGFHLARLDCRQDSRVHAQAIGALLRDPEWTTRDAAAQSERLAPYVADAARFEAIDDEVAARCRDVFATLAASAARYGADAIGLYVISMARSAADVLAVLALARHGGFVDRHGDVPLDVAPLFETIDDLRGGPQTLKALLTEPVYRAHLSARGDRQVVMLGYSDSGKDGGTVASRWSLQRAQVELLEVAQSAGIRLTFFHGRGGSASRGGGKIVPALLSSPRGSVAGVFRVTEQGEVIHRKYGIRALALRSLEQMAGATLRASLRPRVPEPREAGWREAMAAVATSSREAYRAFVDAPDFVDYFRLATPIDVIERMTLGSRPSRRGTMKGVESLRAIPWVFAWTQCRAIITAWYGLGSALERAAKDHGKDHLVEMARDWAFFRVMLDDVDMVLAKCDIDIAERFSRLAGALHDSFFPQVRAEFERTVHWVLALRGNDRLLAQDRRLAESIRLRNPYVDPISLMQVDLLTRWRQGQGQDDALLHALVATVNGVAQGLQNTG
ncbi:MAG TPA: phosphoenolpyruvate carboxylase [Nevskiaceae bacterium]|nr:phosphoenolpyruvate carboxylase [Nevskiaceae bacterium]